MSSIRPADETHVSLAPARSAGTALWLLIVVMAAIIVPLIALSQVIAYYRTDVVDDQMFGYYGWRILHGATVYRDVWDNKPPGIYWINALGFLVGDDTYFGVIGLCVVALVVSHIAFFVIAASVFSRGAAALTTILLSFFLTHAYYTGGTNRTETFLVMFELLAVALYFRGFARDRWWKWCLAGLLCGLAFLCKQVGLAALGAMGLHTILLAVFRDLPWRTGVKRCLLLLVGAVTSVGAAAGVLAWQGALREAWFAVFTFNRAYVSTGDVQFPFNYASWALLQQHMYPILVLPLLMAAAAIIHSTLWWLRPQHRPPEIASQLVAQGPVCPRYMLVFLVWGLAAFYGALLSPSHFRHYLVAMIPPLLLLAGYLVNVLRAEARLLRRLQQRAWVTAAFVVMAYFSWQAIVLQVEEVSRFVVYRILQGEPAEWEVVGDAVAHWTRPTDKIQCFGYLPGVYLRARRINATRFTTTEKVGQVRGGARFVVDEMEAKLRADPPAVLVMPAGDYLWMKQGDRKGQPSDFKLAPWIDEHYRLVQEIPRFGNIYIFKRTDLLPPAESQGIRPQT
jgi:4-amino-4-deoxy-L-arabinose transferase-like glycosyltransferase